MKTLSVSVAAYNMAALIPQCLDSFVQSGVLKDVEILVTDDGSGDETPEIVKRYVKKYPDSVKLVIQENQGPGSTVRSGAERATGKYFRMVDSDDWVDPKAFAALVRRLKETDADLVCCSFTKVDDKTGKTELCPVRLPKGAGWGKPVPFPEVARDMKIFMHNAVYKTEIFKPAAPRILNGFYTDTLYLLLPVPDVKTVEFFEPSVYQYRVSLEGQSMSYPSLQKHVKQHRAMLGRVIDLYESYSARPGADRNVSAFLLAKAAYLCGTQTGIDLSFPPEPAIKRTFYMYYDAMKEKHPAVFAEYSKLRTAKALRFRFLYGLVSRLHRKKIGIA